MLTFLEMKTKLRLDGIYGLRVVMGHHLKQPGLALYILGKLGIFLFKVNLLQGVCEPVQLQLGVG